MLLTALFQSVSIADDALVHSGSVADGVAISREPAIHDAAKKGFDTLLEVTRGKDFNRIYRAFGFASPAEAIDLKLGPPLLVRWVRLDRLKQFEGEDTNPKNLLEPTFQALFPILSRDRVVTSLNVASFRNMKMWKVTQWGGRRVILGLTQLEQYKTSRSSFVVWIPALGIHFLADQIAGQLTLIPIADYPRFKLEAGHKLPAQKAFSQLRRAVESLSLRGQDE
jgi:hypothetical protein